MSLERVSFLVALVAVSLVFLWLVSGFMMPVFWAAILAIVFHPVQSFMCERLGERRSLASALTLIIILVTVIVPSMILVSAVANEAANLYAQIESGEIDPNKFLDWAQGMMPQGIEMLDKVGIDIDQIRQKISVIAISGSQFVGGLAIKVGQNAVHFAVMFFMMLYLLFFLLRDGHQLLEMLIKALPLGDERERALFAKFAEVSRATVKGTMLIGAIQGFLGGLMFTLVGIEAAVFWGVIMMVLSLLPVVGASLVWGPAAIYMFITGETLSGLFLLGFGAVVVGLIDNLLRPLLVGRDTQMPDYLVLLSTLGGITFFGVSGFVIGPVIAALFLAMWVMFAEDHAPEILP